MSTGTRPAEVAAGVYRVVRGTGKSNVYLVRSGSSWVLIDTGWSHQGALIKSSAEMLFGADTPPAAILVTHLHPDHAGSAAELARAWNVPVYVHPDELPPPGGKLAYTDPVGRLIEPFAQFVPAGEFEAGLRIAAAFDLGAGVPGLPDWQCIPTPGHTPGHASYYRAADGVLIAGDALLTVSGRSLWGVLPGEHQVSGPPRISTWDWAAATKSVARLADLEPKVLAPGHGTPMTGPGTSAAVRAFSDRLAAGPPATGGLLRPVDYSSRTRYRRPPETYARLQWLAPLAVAAGMTPSNVVVLEVPGRNTGVIRRTTLVRADCDGGHYLVALAGESEWVRNVRAAGGRAVIGPGRRRAVRLAEVPPEQRAPVLRAYLRRSGRQPGSKTAASEARYYFGVTADPSLEELGQIATYYPVFRIFDDAG
jgi:glyoxylase-like metal-dependent hydrolase (beta-lactamase superfamily II)